MQVANVSLLSSKDFKQTGFARLNNNTYLYIKKKKTVIRKLKQHTRKINQEWNIIIREI